MSFLHNEFLVLSVQYILCLNIVFQVFKDTDLTFLLPHYFNHHYTQLTLVTKTIKKSNCDSYIALMYIALIAAGIDRFSPAKQPYVSIGHTIVYPFNVVFTYQLAGVI